MNTEIKKETVQLQDFPPRLQIIAKHILNSDRIITLNDSIKELKLNKKSIYNGISSSRKKGKDFYEFLNRSFQIMLSRNKYEVGKALVREAVLDSHADRKLFFQLTGDLKEQTVSVTNTLTIGIAVNVPYPNTQEEKGVIDVEPVIPVGE